MRQALLLAARGRGLTSPNPMVGAVLVRDGKLIGQGWHRRAGGPHAEVEALRDARKRGHRGEGATLFVTLEPCCTYGRTPPCTEAIVAAGIRRVVVGATDPNPRHCGRAYPLLRRNGIEVVGGVLEEESRELNEVFNHWVTTGTPLVTVKAAMTLDGKIATAVGESKWITGAAARQYGMRLRKASDAILVGINTILADDPSLTLHGFRRASGHQPRRIILDALARTPLQAKVLTDPYAAATTVFVTESAPGRRLSELRRRVKVVVAPVSISARRGHVRRPDVHLGPKIDLRWVLKTLGSEQVTSLLVEGGGEVNASFLLDCLAHRVAFFYAPKILGGRDSRRAVAGEGAADAAQSLDLFDITWRKLGPDLLLTAKVAKARPRY